jgi:hypothetical protein
MVSSQRIQGKKDQLDCLVSFVFNDRNISYPAKEVTTIYAARIRLSKDLSIPSNEIVIGQGETLSLSDDTRLLAGRYSVKRLTSAVPTSLHCFLTLNPIPPIDSGRPLRREVTVDISHELKTVSDLIKRYFPRHEFPLDLKVQNNDVVLNPGTLISSIAPDSSLVIEYATPSPDSEYLFCFSGNKLPEKLVILSDATVADVKAILLPQCGIDDALPSVLKLTFWTIELSDGDLFASLGLPTHAEITIERNISQQIVFRPLQGGERTFQVTESDRISSLKALLARATSMSVGDFVLRSGGVTVDESQRIRELPEPSVEAVSPFIQFEFTTGAGPRSVSLLPNATVSDARTALAAQLGQLVSLIVLLPPNSSEICQDDVPLRTDEHLHLSVRQDMTFSLDGQILHIPVDFDAPIYEIKQDISLYSHIPSADLTSCFFTQRSMTL